MSKRLPLRRLALPVSASLPLLSLSPLRLPLPLLFLPLLLLLLSPLAAQVPPGYTLEKDEDGARVYLRSEEGDDVSVLVQIEARTTVAAAVAVLNAVAAYPAWVHRCAEAEQLPGGSATSFTYRSVVDLPFPFRDREVVALITQEVSADGAHFSRHITSTPTAIPPTEGVSRMERYEADWLIMALNGPATGTALLQCTVRTDAGSGLPNWLRRDILTGGPVQTMLNLRRRCEQSR